MRCHYPSASGYAQYGAKGVTVCDEWRGRGGFERFLEHVGPRPSEHHSIDRIDGSRGYEPGNVRWSDATEQGRNKTNLVMVEWGGEMWNVSDLARAHGMSPSALHNRLRRGFSVEDAVSVPLKEVVKKAHPLVEVKCCVCGAKMVRDYASENRLAAKRKTEGAVCSAECAWKKSLPPGTRRPRSISDPEFFDWFFGLSESEGEHLLMPSTHMMVDGRSMNVKEVAAELYRGGPLPEGHGVVARCPEARCVEASHLAVATWGKIGRRKKPRKKRGEMGMVSLIRGR